MQVKETTNVVQSNFLLENRPKFNMDETRLFLTIIAAINKEDDDFTQLKIPVLEFAELWGVEVNAAYRKIKDALRGLVQKEFFMEGVNPNTGKTRFLSMSYLSMATYEQGEGYATIEISQAFKPYLLALKKNYTKYVLKNILSLSSVNSIRNYELMKQYESIGKRTFTVDEYKKILHIEEKYSRNTDLRVNVIEPACKEITENTDISVGYEMLGRGQKAKVQFTIASNREKNGSLSAGEGGRPKTPVGQEDGFLQDSKNLTDFQVDLLEAIPEEVHGGDITRIQAILDIATRYIVPANFMEFYESNINDTEEDRLHKITIATQAATEHQNQRVLDAIQTYTIRDYNPRRANIRNPQAYFAYYLAGFDGWLMNHQF